MRIAIIKFPTFEVQMTLWRWIFYSSMYRSWLDVHYRSPFFRSTSCISTNIIYLNFLQLQAWVHTTNLCHRPV
jgi:hypothetical protein